MAKFKKIAIMGMANARMERRDVPLNPRGEQVTIIDKGRYGEIKDEVMVLKCHEAIVERHIEWPDKSKNQVWKKRGKHIKK